MEWATISEMHIMLGVLMELTLYFLVFILIYFSLKISKLRLTSGKEASLVVLVVKNPPASARD